MMDARRFLVLLRGEAKRVIAAIEREPGSRTPTPNIAAIEAILSCVYLFEQYTGAQRGLAPILKPIVLAVFREQKGLAESLAIIVDQTTRMIDKGDLSPAVEASERTAANRV